MPTPNYPLGRRVNHDPRSRAFASTAIGPLKSIKHRCYIPILDQGNLGACTGFALTAALGHRPFYGRLPVETRRGINTLMGRALYSEATKIDPFSGQWPTEDTGSDGTSVCKVAKKLKLISGYNHAFSTDAALYALTQRPIIIGVNWYSDFFRPDPFDGQIYIGTGGVVGGHEICLDQIDIKRKVVWFRNSWGAGWGVDGRAKMSFGLLDRLLNDDGDATIPVPIPSATASWLERLWAWMHQ